MAFWQRKSNGRVFVYYRHKGRQCTLARDDTRHLDAQPDHNVAHWVAEWTKRNEGREAKPVAVCPDDLRHHIDGYLTYLRSRGKASKTVGDHARMLDDYVVPYFITHLGLNDPNKWPAVSAKMAAWIRKQPSGSEHQVGRANTALSKFWEYLIEEQAVLDVGMRTRAPAIRAKPTPLKRTLTPDEAFAVVTTLGNREAKIMGLLGYFFSLRPQETFALRRCDLRAGSNAALLECCRVMAAAKRYDKFAVEVHRQRCQDGSFDEPKAHSIGWVACFDERAARSLLVELAKGPTPKRLAKGELRQFPKGPEDLILRFKPDWCETLWTRAVKGTLMGGFTLKDLRRASLYWLGHYSGLEFPALKNHARHKKGETTLLYMRRPGERMPTDDATLDLDA